MATATRAAGLDGGGLLVDSVRKASRVWYQVDGDLGLQRFRSSVPDLEHGTPGGNLEAIRGPCARVR
jgi:hypothetical protein